MVSERLTWWSPPWQVRMHLMRYRYASARSRGACVLDAACGPGYGAAMLATEGKAARVVAVDISEAAIAGARRK